MSNLRVERTKRLPLQQRSHPARVLLTQPSDQDCIQSVQVSAEVPEASLASEASVDEYVEAVDAEECGVTLATREDVEGRVREPDVAYHV